MMVETMLESSQDFGMSNGSLPQWKRELLQRRAARSRPAAAPAPAPPAPPPPPPPADDDEELRYGPGIVKRLKSRYLSLALREAPRRRPSVLRRATSLEHLLDERPPPAPRPRPARPVSLAAPSHALVRASPRRDSVKRARSVDALSRLDVRDDPPQLPAPPAPRESQPPPPPPSPPPPLPRSARPPRRPGPLLRETERPPPDVVRSTLRKFEAAPARRPAPAARVSAVLRGLEGPARTSTPEPRGRSPSPAAADISAIDEPEGAALAGEARRVPRAALDSIARAGSTVRYAFEAPRAGSHLPPLAATNAVLLSRCRASASPRRIGVIRPMPTPEKPAPSPPPVEAGDEKVEELPRIASPGVFDGESPPRAERKDPPPSALVEPIPRTPPAERAASPARPETVEISAPRPPSPEPEKPVAAAEPEPASEPLVNGHATVEKAGDFKREDKPSKIGSAGIERAWTGAKEKKGEGVDVCGARAGGAWGAGGRRLRAPVPAATSVVFNFSSRKEVPDYIEDDGVVRRANRRNMFKAGEPGVVLLRADALADAGAGSDEDDEPERPPSPCSVRFVNDNVLINGRSSMAAAKLSRDRQAKLKLQFDDSLTRTFEYPSEISLCEESPAAETAPAPAAAPVPACAPAPACAAPTSTLAANTHIVSAALSQYTPSKTVADSFALGLTRRPDEVERSEVRPDTNGEEAEAAAEAGDARPCAAESARSWSESRTLHTDLLF
ncbi:serine/arginine repetitive matrix protein 1 [Aricia agestis]|uniref:serine/arginine repetitive matrix protein 1 n=1 Tax=Aricia agestis TaxID=91739 RepID=UPI001C201F6E|nr:serine/arginine repetitive matrix protein 1 [Aricia agestis]